MTELKNCSTNFHPELCGVNIVVDPQTVAAFDGDKVLIIGEKTTDGVGSENQVYEVSDSNRLELFGAQSMLNRQIDEFMDIAPGAEIHAYIIPSLNANGAPFGTVGTATVAVTVPSDAVAGNLYLWVNGRSYQVGYDPEIDTENSIADKFQAIISATDTSLTVDSNGNEISIETISVGKIGGFIDVRSSYSRRPSMMNLSGVDLAIDVTPGNGVPDLSGITQITEGFEFVINPYTDENSISNVSEYLCSQWSGGANSRAFGVIYGNLQKLTAFGNNTNNALLSYIGVKGALTPPYLESASYGALAYNQLNSESENIAMNMTGIVMPAMLAPERSALFTDIEKSVMIENGVGYFNVTRVNDVNIGRAVTTYTVRDNNSLDYSLRDVNKPSLIAYISTYMSEALTSRYAGYAFRRDGLVGTVGQQKIATLPAVRNYIISIGQELSDRNVIQDLDGFVSSIELKVNESTGCIEVSISPELVDTFCCLNVILRTI